MPERLRKRVRHDAVARQRINIEAAIRKEPISAWIYTGSIERDEMQVVLPNCHAATSG